MTHVAVAGGTGVVGRHVVGALTQTSHHVTVIARSAGVDVLTGEGLAEALEPASVVIDVANPRSSTKRKAVRFFAQATANLLAAERQAGVRHHVALSIVGSDRVDLGYYFGKRRQEELIRAGDVPWTILRATQFHEFPAQLAERVPGPRLPVRLPGRVGRALAGDGLLVTGEGRRGTLTFDRWLDQDAAVGRRATAPSVAPT